MNLTIRVNNSKLCKENKKLLIDFIYFCELTNLGQRRISKKVASLIKTLLLLNKPVSKLVKKDYEKWYINLKQQNYATWTKYDRVTILRQFIKWAKGKNKYYPDEIEWMKFKSPPPRVTPSDILNEDEQKRFLDSCINLRDKAFFNLLLESGARITEIMSMKIKDFDLKEENAYIRFPQGKTGARTIVIIKSIPFILNWLMIHPGKEDLDSFLWTKKNENVLLGRSGIRNAKESITRRARIKKRVYFHLFRHTCASELARKGWSEAEMCKYLGWKHGSNMPAVYIHLTARDLEKKVKERYGLKTDKEHSEATLKECPSCRTLNDYKAKFCSQCHRTLDLKAAQQMLDKDMHDKKERLSYNNFIINNPEFLKELIQKVKNEMNKE